MSRRRGSFCATKSKADQARTRSAPSCAAAQPWPSTHSQHATAVGVQACPHRKASHDSSQREDFAPRSQHFRTQVSMPTTCAQLADIRRQDARKALHARSSVCNVRIILASCTQTERILARMPLEKGHTLEYLPPYSGILRNSRIVSSCLVLGNGSWEMHFSSLCPPSKSNSAFSFRSKAFSVMRTCCLMPA